MIIEPLAIDGAFKITPKVLQDDRGAFARTFCADVFEKNGLFCQWNQMNVSRSKLVGTIRGLHYQRPPYCEIKLVRCVTGIVYDVIVDVRANSKTFGKTCAVKLRGDTMEMVYIPEGCAHGFQTQTDDVELHYSHSQPYKPDFEGGILPTDPNLSIAWPKPVATLSERDRNHPQFDKVEPILL